MSHLNSSNIRRQADKIHSAAIVIPIYKSELTDDEALSLIRCKQILGDFSIYLMSPDSLDIDELLNRFGIDKNQVLRFEDNYFTGPEAYSELLLSHSFYATFDQYDYMLIYQLDAYVFQDDLDYWMNKGYDYIGAPWYGAYFPNSLEFRKGLPIWRSNLRLRKIFKEPSRLVGNGGFSLRKIKSFKRNLKRYKKAAEKWHCREYEDTFFAIALPNLNPFFKIPNANEARFFSLELKAREQIEEMGELPFGCHAWQKHDEELYHEYIKKTVNL